MPPKTPRNFCDHCGAKTSRLADFCKFCGWPAEHSHPTDRLKFVALGLGLIAMFLVSLIPRYVDPALAAWGSANGMSIGMSSPAAPLLRLMIIITWYVFLAMFIGIITYEVTWAGMGYRLQHAASRRLDREVAAGRLPAFTPSVAILLPVHNEREGVYKTLDSIINQTYGNITQIIVIDDGSNDNTADIVKRLAAEEPRIIYRWQENQGKPAAINFGFRLSTADLSLVMDGDSYLSLNAVELMVRHFRDPRMASVAAMIDVHNTKSLWAKCQRVEFVFSQLITRFCQAREKGVIISPGAATLMKTSVGKAIHHLDRTITEDADFTFSLHQRWRSTQEPDAIGYTEAMVTTASYMTQRLRWLYGVLQTVRLHRWAASEPWITWAWLGYFGAPAAFLIVLALPVLVYTFGYLFLVFFAVYFVISILIFWGLVAMPILWYPYLEKRLILLVPAFVVYQQFLNLIGIYCTLCGALGIGVKVKYGPKTIRAI